MAATVAVGASVGDVVETSGRRVGESGRVGEIVEVFAAGIRPHYRVRWEDGHESILYPGEGVTVRSGRREPVKAGAPELMDFLEHAGVTFEVLPHRRTQTASDEAGALDVHAQTVAKTIVVQTRSGSRIRAVVPASARLDLARLAKAVGVKKVELLREEELAATYPGFELGAVPPFGGPPGERVVVDLGLAECEHVVVEAGVHHVSLRLRSEDLLVVADAQLAEIAAG